MNEYQAILKKVGTALIVVGLFDIAFMVYCIVNETSYSSSFNIFAVIAGIFLYRGGLKTAKVVSFFGAFFLTGMVGLLVVIPFLIPPDLLLTHMRLNASTVLGPLLFGICILGFLVWILKNLTSPIIIEAMDKQGIDRKSFLSRPRSGGICGILLLAILAGTIPLLLKGETAEMAKIEAQKKVVGDYKFSVSSINIQTNYGGKTHVNAVVTAYNDREIKQVQVVFEK